MSGATPQSRIAISRKNRDAPITLKPAPWDEENPEPKRKEITPEDTTRAAIDWAP